MKRDKTLWNYKIFSLMCCMVYFTSYVTRINLQAVAAEIIAAEGIAKTDISFVLMMSFISYGAGQLVSGALGDRINPIKLILYGFGLTVLCNLIIPICGSVVQMSSVWLVNGFAQALMWPPLLKLLVTYLDGERYNTTVANVSAAASVATIFIYIAAPIFIKIGGWRTVFFCSAAAGVAMAILWIALMPRLTAKMQQRETVTGGNTIEGTESIGAIFKKFGLVFICIAIVMQGILRDGIATWLPVCINEVFKVETTVSILVSVVLPIFAIICIKVVGKLQQKFFKNEVKLAGGFLAAAVVISVLWSACYSGSVVLSLICAAAVNSLAHGINFLLLCIVPKRFENCKNISFLSGMLNFFTYIGSAISTYGIAKISEVGGWQATMWTWAAVAAVGAVMCLICRKKYETKSGR